MGNRLIPVSEAGQMVKGKVFPALFVLAEHDAMRAYWESGGIAARIL
jgi:hypothetical protein